MDMPSAEVFIDTALVSRLIEDQHPDVAGPLTLAANGWDNAIYRLGKDLCVRLPRRHVAAQLIENEQRWLPEIAERLTVNVPRPIRCGAPRDAYPWPWTITSWFSGRTAAEVPPAERTSLAADLAGAHTELHVPAPQHAPVNPVRGVPLVTRSQAAKNWLASDAIDRSDELRELWDELSAVPSWDGQALWLHGDPHPANMLLTSEDSAETHLHALLDFGDLTSGDPATDLAAAWLVFDVKGRAIYQEHVNAMATYDENTWKRARGWALAIGAAIAANSDDNPRMAAIGKHALEQVLLPE